MTNKRIITLLCTVLLTLPTILRANPTSQPNVLLIIADDLGLDSSAQYRLSTDLPHTPNLDSLALNGIVFDNAWATPACTTTRGTLITGLHGVNSGIDTVPNKMDTSLNTIQRLLKNNRQTTSYQSAVIGKWHLAGRNPDHSHPNQSGVDFYSGNIAGVMEHYNQWELTHNGVTSESTEYHTTAISDTAIDWIAQQKDPWFVWLAYAAPHSPFHLPPADLHSRKLSGSQKDIKTNKREYYLASIEAMDTSIGRVVNSLTPEQRDNTLIIYLGDNGTPGPVADKAVFPRSRAKGSLFEGGIRVPMTISGAGVARTGQREKALVNTVDLYATIAEATGAGIIKNIDGYSLYKLLSDATAETRKYNYTEFNGKRINGWTVRNKNYKLIQSDDGVQQLYNLSTDLKESNNLLLENKGHYESVVAELESYANTVRSGIITGANTGNVKTATSQSAVLPVVDLTNTILTSTNTNCVSYAQSYQSTATDIKNNEVFTGALTISAEENECVIKSNAIPNHNFNDGRSNFRNPVKPQNSEYRITTNPAITALPTPLALNQDNAVLLNGVKVDILAAGCFNVGNEKTGCTDASQPWRFDPLHKASGFRVDSHNAHTQPDGAYHYHGPPNALYDSTAKYTVVGFAADGFPIFAGTITDKGSLRKVESSYRLKSGQRPAGIDSPGGSYDGTFRDDYEYVAGHGDLDHCNGMHINDTYGYFITDEFPYVLACFSGTPHDSFNKRGR